MLVPTDGPCMLVAVNEGLVTVEDAEPTAASDAVIEGSSRDLLALLLGREARHTLSKRGNIAFAESFSLVFPGP